MAKFDIYSYETHENRQVEAQGVMEAMLECLPWPTLHLDISWEPSSGFHMVTDHQTQFQYKVMLVNTL